MRTIATRQSDFYVFKAILQKANRFSFAHIPDIAPKREFRIGQKWKQNNRETLVQI